MCVCVCVGGGGGGVLGDPPKKRKKKKEKKEHHWGKTWVQCKASEIEKYECWKIKVDKGMEKKVLAPPLGSIKWVFTS